MGLWNKVKGVFSRIGSGIKNVATKTYNTVKGIAGKFAPIIGAGVSTALTGDPMSGYKAGQTVQNVANMLPRAPD